jgi:hypothetical protein
VLLWARSLESAGSGINSPVASMSVLISRSQLIDLSPLGDLLRAVYELSQIVKTFSFHQSHPVGMLSAFFYRRWIFMSR